jgi:D-psicose/D-tagatose/L-ribulose 3-epimerase
MILTVSNIAWASADDSAAEALLLELGVHSLELAPTRQWPDLSKVTEADARAAATQLRARGFGITALQAVLFGQPALQVFGPDGGRACRDYLKAACRLAGWMGAGAVVLGAPKNRLRGDLSASQAFALATDFFREIGDTAAAAHTKLCLEPNPTGYGADFLLTAAEATAMVQAADSPGIALNFDMGEQAMHDADAAANIQAFAPWIGHFHISEPMLEPFDPARASHAAAAAALRAAGYAGAVSMEMKTPPGGLPVVQAALAALKEAYQL